MNHTVHPPELCSVPYQPHFETSDLKAEKFLLGGIEACSNFDEDLEMKHTGWESAHPLLHLHLPRLFCCPVQLMSDHMPLYPSPWEKPNATFCRRKQLLKNC
jgi:hypothetical protein